LLAFGVGLLLLLGVVLVLIGSFLAFGVGFLGDFLVLIPFSVVVVVVVAVVVVVRVGDVEVS
jgi:hypothetical protein